MTEQDTKVVRKPRPVVGKGLIGYDDLTLDTLAEKKQITARSVFDDPTFKRYMLGDLWRD